MSARFDPRLFFQRADNVALHVPAAELFGLLKRTLVLPHGWAALTRRATGDSAVVPGGGEVHGEDLDDVLFVRVTPVVVSIVEELLVSRDRFRCTAEVQLSLSAVPERSELTSFLCLVVGSRRVVQAEALARFVQPEVHRALAALAAETDAADLVHGRNTGEYAAAAASALERVLFSAGLMLSAAPVVRFESESVRAVQETQQRAAVERAENAAARQVKVALEQAQGGHLDHLAHMLERLRKLAMDSPAVDLPELIRTFSQRERGEIYEAMFRSHAPETRTRWIVTAAGDELIFSDPAQPEEPRRRLNVSGGAGPVRSIEVATDEGGRPVLWLGAATGVYRWPIDQSEPDLTLTLPDAGDVRGGFNAVAAIGDRVFASHSELGLVEWDVAEPSIARKPCPELTRAAKAVRAVCCFENDLYCAIDNRVIRRPVGEPDDGAWQTYSGSTSTITAVRPIRGGLFAGTGDGDVLHWPGGRFSDPDRLHTGAHRAAESVWHVATDGVERLIYADTSLHVHARVLGDSYACRYEAGGQTLRRVEVSPDLLVATNDLRDRLICWTPGEPGTPRGVIGVSRLTGRSIQDVCLVPKA